MVPRCSARPSESPFIAGCRSDGRCAHRTACWPTCCPVRHFVRHAEFRYGALQEWVQFTLLKLHVSRAVLSLGIPLIFCDADVAWLADARRALTHANQPSNHRPSLRFSSEVRYWETPPGRSPNTGVYSALPDPGAIRVFTRAIERRCVALRHSVRRYALGRMYRDGGSRASA